MNNMKKHDIKMIVLDIDGTIMDGNFQISERIKKTIQLCLEKNIKITLATGRMHDAAVPIAKEIGLCGPIISYQGSIIKEVIGNKTLLNESIEFATAIKAINELRQFEGQINFFTENQLISEKITPLLREYAEKRAINFKTVSSFEKLKNFSPIKLLFINNDAQKLKQIKKYMREKFPKILNIFQSTDYFCEIVGPNATKGNAIQFLAKLWNIELSQILAIGDQENDIEMLKTAGVSVAMGNAIKEVKEITTYITDTVEMGGAATAIEKIALGL